MTAKKIKIKVYSDRKEVTSVTSIIKQANDGIFKNIDQSEVALALREAKKQKGTEVHKT